MRSIFSWGVEKCERMQQLIEDYLDYLRNNNKAQKTLDNRRVILGVFVRSGLDLEIDYMKLEDYFTSRGKTLKASSLQLERGVIRSFLEYCQEIRQVKMKFPYSIIRRKKVKGTVNFLTRDEVTAAVKFAKNQQDKLMVSLLFETGMRIGELVNIKAEDISGEEIRVVGKGSKPRVVFMPRELSRQVANHLIENRITKGYVFQPLQKNKNQEKYAIDSVRKRIKRCFSGVGVEMHPHMLRHGYGTELYQKKVDLRAIQTLMGHANISTTEVYTHVTDPFLKEVYQAAMPISVIA